MKTISVNFCGGTLDIDLRLTLTNAPAIVNEILLIVDLTNSLDHRTFQKENQKNGVNL